MIKAIQQPAGTGPREFRCICTHDLATHIVDLSLDESICSAAGCSCNRCCLWEVSLQAPDNKVYVVHDVAKFVRIDFPQLFSRPEIAIKIKPHDNSDYTSAEDGLRALARGNIGSWHGWTVLTKSKTFKP